MKNNKLYTYPIIGVFAAFIFAVLILFLFTPQTEYNEKENKDLAMRPLLSESESFNAFAAAWDGYVSDQFPGRSALIDRANDIEIAQGSSVVQDVYVLDSDYLFNFVYPIDDWKPKALATHIDRRRNQLGIPFIYMIVPQKNMLLEEGVPGLSATTDWDNFEKMETAMIDGGIPYIESCRYMAAMSLEEKSQLYFKTDIHWNDKGAFTCSKYIAEQLVEMGLLKKAAIPRDSDFTWYDFTGRDFSGDLAKRFGIESVSEEYIPVYTINGHDSCYYFDTLDDSHELMRDEIILTGMGSDEAFTYSTLSMQNYPYIRIENPRANEEKSILILKDSLQCATVDYFSQMYSEINIVDPRFPMKGLELETIVRERGIDMVFCFFHCNNCSSDLLNYVKLAL